MDSAHEKPSYWKRIRKHPEGTGASWHQNTDRLSERQANRDAPGWYGCQENGGEVPESDASSTPSA